MIQLDKNVEQEFLAAFVQGNDLITKELLDSVEERFFSIDSYRWFVGYLKSRDWKPISKGYLNQVLLDNFKDPDEREKYRVQLELLFEIKLTFIEDADTTFRSFCAERKVENVIKSSLTSLHNSNRIDYCLRDLEKGLSEARSIISTNKLRMVDYVDTYDIRMEKRRRERDNPDLSPTVRTGIDGLDHQFYLKKNMVVDFLAPFKRGKSIMLNTVAFSAFLQGFNVCQIVFENSEEMTFNRLDSLFSQISYNRISNLLISEEERSQIDGIFNWMKGWDNKFKIIKAKSNETSVSHIKDEIYNFGERENWFPDVLVVDYLNIIGPDEKHKRYEERLQQKEIFWALKNLTEELNVLTYTATQSNMEGIKDGYGSGRLKLSSRGKSIDISQGLDLSIAIDQNEVEKETGQLVLSPHFYRHGAIKQDEIALDSNLDYMTFDRGVIKLWNEARERYLRLSNGRSS